MSQIIQDTQSESARVIVYLSHRDSIEKNIDRRYAMTKFNFSVIGAVGVAFWFLRTTKVDVGSSTNLNFSNIILAFAAFFCAVWIFQILRFREVSRIKHEIAIEMEKDLGLSAITGEERKFVQESSIVEYTHIEVLFPAMIALLCIVGLLY